MPLPSSTLFPAATVLPGGSTATPVARVSLAQSNPPITRTAHSVKVRARVTTAVQGTVRVRLYEGATARTAELETTALTTSLATYTVAIADADAAAIVNYSNLELEFYGYSSTGAAATFAVAELSVETPVTLPFFSGTVAGVGSATGGLSTPGGGPGLLVGTAAGVGAVAGALTARTLISGTTTGVGTLDGTIGTTGDVWFATMPWLVTNFGVQNVPFFSGTAAGVGHATGALVTPALIVSTAAGVGTAFGGIQVPGPALLSGTTAGVGAATAAPTTAKPIIGTAAGVSAATGVLTVPGAAPLAGVAAGVGLLSGSLGTGAPVVGGAAAFTLVRELPPLRQDIEITTPSGRTYRWAEDEPDPANVPSGVRHSSTMPGGDETFDATLPRLSGVDYDDVPRLSRVRVRDAGAGTLAEFRLDRSPSVSGDQMAVSPSAVGMQDMLNDNKSASVIFVDASLQNWKGPPLARKNGFANGNANLRDAEVVEGSTPTLRTAMTGAWERLTETNAFYDGGAGVGLGSLLATWTRGAQVGAGDPNWNWEALLSSDELASSIDFSGNLRGTGPGDVALNASVARRYAWLRSYYAVPGGGAGVEYPIDWTNVRVIGDHGLPRYTYVDGDGVTVTGFLASDMVAAVLDQFVPGIAHSPATIIPSSFVVPHATFANTTPGEMVTGVTRYGLQDWAVWPGPTMWWYPRGAFGTQWRARISPAQLQETGPQVDRLWESVVVEYSDVDGSTRTAGPPGSGSDTEDPLLKDADPNNPANELGIVRRQRLAMGGVSNPEGAIEVGRRFLEESKALDRSGQATIVGYCLDSRGVLHPYYDIKAGDTIAFVDAADPSPRRIARVEHDRAERTATVDLDAPPEGLAALLDRLQVVLVPDGFQ